MQIVIQPREKWKEVRYIKIGNKRYEHIYDKLEVSNYGNVRRTTKNEIHYFKKTLSSAGYYRVDLTVIYNGTKIGKHVLVHRLVAESFREHVANKDDVNHINGVKTDNRSWNLEWVNDSENMRHAFDNNLVTIKYGDESHSSKITSKIIISDIIPLIKSRLRYKKRLQSDDFIDIAKIINETYNSNISKHCISHLYLRHSWKKMTELDELINSN